VFQVSRLWPVARASSITVFSKSSISEASVYANCVLNSTAIELITTNEDRHSAIPDIVWREASNGIMMFSCYITTPCQMKS
jgi:hypothetical protein